MTRSLCQLRSKNVVCPSESSHLILRHIHVFTKLESCLVVFGGGQQSVSCLIQKSDDEGVPFVMRTALNALLGLKNNCIYVNGQVMPPLVLLWKRTVRSKGRNVNNG